MHEVDRGARLHGDVDRLAHRLHLGLHGPARGEVLDAAAAGREELGGPRRDDGVVLGMYRHERAGLGRRAHQRDVVIAAFDEARAHHEDLESRVPLGDQVFDLVTRGVARIGDHDVEREIRDGPRRIAQTALEAGAERSVLLVDHRHHRRHAARDGGARAVREVVERRPRRRGCQMGVQVDAARKHDLPARVQLFARRPDLTDGRDALARDGDVNALLAVRSDDETAADR